MADQTVEIKFQLRDEISKAAEQAVAKLLRLDQVSTGKARRELDVLGRSAAFAAREIRSLATITGVGGVLGAGGIVAGLVAAKRSLDQFVESGIKTHYTARELGVSAGMLRNYTDALRVVGQSEGEAAGGVQSALRTLEEAWTEGRGSSMFRQLAKSVGDTGTKVFRELMQTYGREGPEAALNLALKRMEGMSARAQAHFSRIMGFGTVGATELRRILPQLVPVIRMSKEQMLEYQVANINLDRTWGNIKTQIGTALLPAFTELTKAIDQYLRSDAGKKFLADIKRWINSISDAIKSEGFAQSLEAIVKDTEQAVVELNKSFVEADKVVKAMGLTWPQVFGLLIGSGILVFLARLAAGLAGIARFRMMFPQLLAISAIVDLLMNKKEIREELQRQQEQTLREHPDAPQGGPEALPGLILQILRDLFKGNIELWGKGKKTGALAPEGTGKADVERLADAANDRAAKGELTRQFAELDYEVGKLVDYLQPGGPEGKRGRSGYQFPDAGGTIAKAGVFAGWPLTAIPRGNLLSSVSEGIGRVSKYANYQGKYLWGDPGPRGDKPESNALGVPEASQGISLSNRATLGRWHLVTTNEGLQYKIQQTDTGPGSRIQRLIDVAGPAAEAMGLTPKTFPTDAIWQVQPTQLTVGDVERVRRVRAANKYGGLTPGGPGWHRSGGGGGFDETIGSAEPMPDTSAVTRALASEGSINGTASVDIDISSAANAKDASVGENLFRPLIIQRTAQMAATGSDRSTPSNFNQA